jgi:hypothetical protein
MEIFAKGLQGVYAYILIFQILVVCMLFLFLLWLVIRRIQEPKLLDIPMTAAVAAVEATAIPASQSEAELQAKIVELEKDKALSQTATQEHKTLTEKVKYLESKLLEYEILQEEIGTLSSLKLENEDLKQKIMEFQMKSNPLSFEAPEPKAISQSPETQDLAPPSPQEPETISTEPAPAIFIPPAEGNEPVALSTDATEINGLSNLLEQIDQLTKATDKQA